MSNALSRGRKKNRFEPLGYTKTELDRMQRQERKRENADNLIRESYYNLRLIAYQLLHDDFGYGNKRIVRVEQTIDKYFDCAANGEVKSEEFQSVLKTKFGIDAIEEANKIPFRELFALTEKDVFSREAGKYILASVCNYFTLLGVCLKTQMKVSSNRIKQLYGRIRYYINSISTGYETMTGVASVLYQECKYCDSRFIGKFYKV